MPDEATCIHCGCTDSMACDGGCAWLAVDREAGVGVCSSCADSFEAAFRDLREYAEA